jgi:hypothetical protein
MRMLVRVIKNSYGIIDVTLMLMLALFLRAMVFPKRHCYTYTINANGNDGGRGHATQMPKTY